MAAVLTSARKAVHDAGRRLEGKINDPLWRIMSGELYKVKHKVTGAMMPFVPWETQKQVLRNMHTRNVIPKARQRGVSHIIQIWMLDSALFQDNQTGVVIAQDDGAATDIFRNKLKFAYDNLPEFVRAAHPLIRDSQSEIMLGNGSQVKVTVSARSGTVQMLHVSEFGKIAAANPGKAREVITGSIEAVPTNGVVFVESTARGRGGEFYKMVQQAIKLHEKGATLTPLDYRLHFYSWWDADEYRINPNGVVITPELHDYFNGLEIKLGISLSADRRAWYVKKLESLGGDKERMWEEYPSDIDEPFQVSTEGTYYAQQFKSARQDGRMGRFPHDPTLQVATFWDIGANDETAIWCVQQDGKAFNVVNYIEASGEPFSYFVNWLRDTGYTWSTHFLPHDAEQKRQQGLQNKTAKQMLQDICPGWRFIVVPRIADTMIGIQQTRDVFGRCYFDEARCSMGLAHLELYKKSWDASNGIWRDIPKHDEHSNGADAFRQLGQAVANRQFAGTDTVYDEYKSIYDAPTDWRLA